MARGKKKVNNQSDKDIILNELFGLALIALSLIITASIIALSREYITQDSNPGAIGSILVRAAEALMGEGKYLLAVFLFYLGYRYIKHNVGIKYDVSTLGFGLILIAFLMYLHRDVTFITYQDNFYEAFKGAGGGLLGALFVVTIRTLFGLVGAWIVGITFLIAGVIMFTRQSLKNILGNMKSSTKNVWDSNKDTLFDMLFVEEEISSTAADSLPRAEDTLKHASPKKSLLIDMSDHDSSKRAHLNGVNVINSDEHEDSGKLFNEEADADVVIESLPFIPEVKTQSASVPKGKGEHKLEAVAAEKDVPIIEANHTSNFILPAFNLLDAKSAKSKGSQRDISGRVAILEETIQSFGINAKVTQVSCGPTVTRFELDIPPGVKVSKITGLADNIALRLAAKGVRIAPIPDQATIGIEVPNKEISPVSFRDVLDNESFLNSSSKLSVALGKDISGRSIIANLAKMPHLLVAGTTGSGKSVCMNTIICSILFKATPKDVRFLMIDPKMVELAGYNGIPHLLAPVVTDPKKAAAVLKWMVTEMDNRYEMFAQSNVRDIVRYNQQKLKSGNDLQTMPYYVVIIDELADLMMVASQDVEESICRIAQKARAAGIHLVIATQRPSVDVITGLIKANIPSRIAFAVSSQTDSRTILDGAGAEKLLGRGDMLFHPVGEQNPIRIQGAFVSDKEVENIVGFLKESSSPPQYEEGVLEAEITKSEDKADTGEDALFYRAGITLIEAGQASSSMLQRRLRVGYARAARLIDLLEDNGVVGPHEGSKPRQIIMSLEEFENRFSHQNLED